MKVTTRKEQSTSGELYVVLVDGKEVGTIWRYNRICSWSGQIGFDRTGRIWNTECKEKRWAAFLVAERYQQQRCETTATL